MLVRLVSAIGIAVFEAALAVSGASTPTNPRRGALWVRAESSVPVIQSSRNEVSPDGLWRQIDPVSIPVERRRLDIRGPHIVVQFDRTRFEALTKDRPSLHTNSAATRLTLPLPDGRFVWVDIAETSVLSPELAAASPETRTFAGTVVDVPRATVRLDWTAAGFHAALFEPEDTTYVDPYVEGDVALYAVYKKADLYIDPKVRPRGIR